MSVYCPWNLTLSWQPKFYRRNTKVFKEQFKISFSNNTFLDYLHVIIIFYYVQLGMVVFWCRGKLSTLKTYVPYRSINRFCFPNSDWCRNAWCGYVFDNFDIRTSWI